MPNRAIRVAARVRILLGYHGGWPLITCDSDTVELRLAGCGGGSGLRSGASDLVYGLLPCGPDAAREISDQCIHLAYEVRVFEVLRQAIAQLCEDGSGVLAVKSRRDYLGQWS